jgi:predicted acyltransferase
MSEGNTTIQRPVSRRLLSIDVLRGLTVAFMILVNNNGNNALAFRMLNHAEWNGFTPTDLVFPTFLLIMGISMELSFPAREGLSRTVQAVGIARRFALLFLLGLIVNGFPFFHWESLRIYGVLQRIAVCYLLAALLQRIPAKIVAWIALVIASLAGYWALLRYLPVPGYGVPTHGFPLLDKDINIAAWLDRQIFPRRLFEGTRDPEGLLSDLPALGTTLIGLLAGAWLKTQFSARQKLRALLGSGVLMLLAGWLWSFSFPINKKLWTSSYVLFAAGWGLLLLALVFYVVEMRQWRDLWAKPFLVFGRNAITAYVFSELLSSVVSVLHVNPRQSIQQYVYAGVFVQLGTPAIGSLIYSVLFVLICFLPAAWLYRRHIFLRL